MIWVVPLSWNGLWNPMYILKKNKYILHKNTYIFSKQNRDSYPHYYDLYIPLGTLGKWFYTFPYLEMDFGTPHTSLRKISTFFTKNTYIFFKGNWDLNHTYCDLYISLGTLEKWFEVFPHHEMDFGESHIHS